MKTESLKLSSITVIPTIQQRAGGLDAALVEEYRLVWRELNRVKRGWKENPVVFRAGKSDATYILAGGFHRFKAMSLEGQLRAAFEVRAGGELEALKFALGDNVDHGKRRTPADLRRAIETILCHSELSKLSARDAAAIVHCDASYFSRMKREIKGDEPDPVKSAAAKSGNEKRKPAEPEATPFDDPPEESSSTADDSPDESTSEGADCPHPEQTALPRDSFGRVIPGWLREAFQTTAASDFENAKKLRDVVSRSGQSFAEGLVGRAVKELAYTVPHAVCPKCDGHGCQECRHKGWVSPPEFEQLPAKLKNVARSYDPAGRGEVDEDGERALAATVQPPDQFAVVRDAGGTAVPAHLRDAFSDVTMRTAAELMKEAASILKSASQWNPHLPDFLVRKTNELAELVDSARPNLICDQCEGKKKGCVHCQTAGFQPASYGG